MNELHQLVLCDGENLQSHPYWVKYKTEVKLQAGGTETRVHNHMGTSSLEQAKKSLDYFKSVIKRTSLENYDSTWGNMLEAWVEYEYRFKLEVGAE